ncbi:MAG: DNA-binding protein [Alphaproteobacteria bacterium]|nr:DNA-binding protein [Alphaproteobacteria bacterium]
MKGQLELSAELERRFERSDRADGAKKEERLLLASEVADLLRVTKAWVYAETRSRRLPHVRLGRYVRYREDAIREWLAAQEAKSARGVL